MPMYSGTLDVEPNEFSLKMGRFDFQREVISFDCYGRIRSTLAMWNFSGMVGKCPEGHYQGYDSRTIGGVETETEIYIIKAKQNFNECVVEGFWYEKMDNHDPEVWRFSGTLEAF